MVPRLSLIGEKFGRLSVIEFVGIKNKSTLWKCLCDCGKTTIVQGNILKYGATISCGCYRSEKLHQKWCKDLVGQKFGKLLVISFKEHNKHNKAIWNCMCDCGNKISVESYHLRIGHTTSCGCYKKELVGENHPCWRGGISFEPYCPKFNKNLRNRVRSFYNYECLICGKSQKENNNRALSVHHVEYNKMSCCDNQPVQFAALCTSCHGKTIHNRKQWESIFHIIIDYLYNGKSYYTKEEYKNLK
jgi:hypothetical protein